jgi:hypothetical protein
MSTSNSFWSQAVQREVEIQVRPDLDEFARSDGVRTDRVRHVDGIADIRLLAVSARNATFRPDHIVETPWKSAASIAITVAAVIRKDLITKVSALAAPKCRTPSTGMTH